jgi:hypothetical protein
MVLKLELFTAAHVTRRGSEKAYAEPNVNKNG